MKVLVIYEESVATMKMTILTMYKMLYATQQGLFHMVLVWYWLAPALWK